jgi:hypothetical protein
MSDINPALIPRGFKRYGRWGGSGEGPSPPPQPWTPADTITTLWLDATDSSKVVFHSDNNITKWISKGTVEDKYVDQGTFSQMPTLEPIASSNLSAIKFGSADHKFFKKNNIFVETSLVVAVASMADGIENLEGFLSNSHDAMNIRRADQEPMYRDLDTPYTDWNDFVYPDGNMWVNGVDTNNVTLNEIHIVAVKGGPSNSSNFNDLQISGAMDDFRNWDGYVGEMIFTELDSERELIEGYLAWKWGVVDKLPDSHPFKASPPYVGDEVITLDGRRVVVNDRSITL